MREPFRQFGLTTLVLAVALGCRPTGGDEQAATDMESRVGQFQDQARARLAAAGAELDRLAVEAARAGDTAAVTLSRHIDTLQAERQDLERRVSELGDHAGEDYDQMAREIQDGLQALETAVAEASQWPGQMKAEPAEG